MNYADKRVLIVEDQRPFLLLLRGLMNSMGATEVVTKSSAEKALAVCRKQAFDVVIADLHLGADQKNGFEFVEELRTRQLIPPSAVVVIISADSARPVVLGSIERRPDDYLIKPFSQAQLKSRLNRAWKKRQALLPVFRAIDEGDRPTAIAACQALLAESGSYTHTVELLLTELYWQTQQYEQARDVLAPYQGQAQSQWMQIALARTYLYLQEPDQALQLCDNVLEQNRFSADAYDIIAGARMAKDDGAAAIEAINQAIKLSPYSLPRHLTACDIARQHRDFELASTASGAIWQLSKRSVHQHIGYWCGYIRSMLDVAEFAEDKRIRNRYQQDAILHLQRGRNDEVVQRLKDDVDLTIFEQMMMARVATIDGKLQDARQALYDSQDDIASRYDQCPPVYVPDLVKVMLDLGEYDEAQPLLAQAKDSHSQLDAPGLAAIEHSAQQASARHALYLKHNRQGIALYQQNKYEDARVEFSLAQEHAPVNTGVALNLIQCILKLHQQQGACSAELIAECRRLNKWLRDTPLRAHHQEKFDDLKDELAALLN